MNSYASNELDCDFAIEQPTAQNETACPKATKRKYDKTLFSRGVAVSTSLENVFKQQLDNRLQLMPEAPAGMTYSVKVTAHAKGTPGASKVLRALIDLALSQRGAKMTQTACREEVQARIPEFAVYKDWTKELPQWAFDHAKKCVLTSAPPLSTLVLRKGSSLRDLHRAAKVACAKSADEALTAKVSLTIAADAVRINGSEFKWTTNKSNGKTYEFIRITKPSLMKVLKA